MTSGAYIYTYTVAGVLWYVGKGSGARAGRHLRRARRYAKGLPMHRISGWQIDLAGAVLAGEQIDIRIVADGMTCTEAFAMEIRMIAELHPLKNILAGGNGNIKRLTS